MSTIAQELDATLEGLEPSSAATLTRMVREAMGAVRGKSATVRISGDLQRWEKRLAARSSELATGKQGASMQQVMDDLRG